MRSPNGSTFRKSGRVRHSFPGDRALSLAVLTEALYDAAAEPSGWSRVLDGVQQRFGSLAQALYFLHVGARTLHLVHGVGVEASYVRSFDEHFFTSENPVLRSEPLHRPGVVRTDQRLLRTETTRQAELVARLLRDTGVPMTPPSPRTGAEHPA